MGVVRERETIAALERCEQEGLLMADLAYLAVHLLRQRSFEPERRASLAAGLIQQAGILAAHGGSSDTPTPETVAGLAREIAESRISTDDTTTNDMLYTATSAAARAVPTPYTHLEALDRSHSEAEMDVATERALDLAYELARAEWATRQVAGPA